MIRDFMRFYRIWRKHRSVFCAIKYAISLILMHRKIDKEIEGMSSEEILEKLRKEIHDENI